MWEFDVSLQIAILKVLSSHPDGRASVAAIKSDLAVLTASGRDWSERVKRLAERAPNLDIFGQRFVTRDQNGWAIAEAGRDFLRSIERPLLDDIADKRLFPEEKSLYADEDEFGFGAEFAATLPSAPQHTAMPPARAYKPRYPIRY
jgi:hypothetical protein